MLYFKRYAYVLNLEFSFFLSSRLNELKEHNMLL